MNKLPPARKGMKPGQHETLPHGKKAPMTPQARMANRHKGKGMKTGGKC